ncbi:hypothetical protein BBO99_00004757 [Phytophthora kernoviae]|uniref:F-box domain-containing protein n=2 Tax=Phytophthora kernoviae TaxID=325452 RepID=A0A421GQK4_9STRA|nr:hypothetical protein G195_005425 [Phytophthora kernoviae 00238/432]KAG2525001.1 hypothetical protein JM16_004421 [Phytophthora kernoviae]KAG2526775.1 hypothetical protein JM18_004212 [Phytophthora kernoviae]RLN14426.1 hypothetical protein BBI17_004782 [Phytophthora kernoviae]RLN80108.1 hypothetical protein BBO99_00004757 [Phytophthora kernoviae]
MAALAWAALPDDVLEAIAGWLYGFDLLQLSRVNGRCFHLLSRAELYASRLSQVHYQQRAVVELTETEFQHAPRLGPSSKRDYALESSFRFGGQREDAESQQLPTSYAPVYWATDTLFGLFAREDDEAVTSPSFTLDAWFSLSVPENGVFQGGVLLGLQNEKCRQVTAQRPRVAAQLKSGRWYHVALVYGGQSQQIFLDGELIDSQYDQELQLESLPYYYAQVGAGCISGDSAGKPTYTYSGWYAFHGVVDDLRVWHEALPAQLVSVLSDDCATLKRRPTFSLKRDVPVWMAHGVERVRCSRPRERRCEVVATCNRTACLDSWV